MPGTGRPTTRELTVEVRDVIAGLPTLLTARSTAAGSFGEVRPRPR